MKSKLVRVYHFGFGLVPGNLVHGSAGSADSIHVQDHAASIEVLLVLLVVTNTGRHT